MSEIFHLFGERSSRKRVPLLASHKNEQFSAINSELLLRQLKIDDNK
jgi:hypothetical protein